MNAIDQVTTSMRSARMRSLAPRILFYSLATILCLAGLRAALSGPAEVAPAAAPAPVRPVSDPGTQAFAEGFVRAYLTWDADVPEERTRRLAAYLPEALDESGGLTPAEGADQDVLWTAVTGVQRASRVTNVSVIAQTTTDQVNLTVPVARDRRGFLYIAGYPALVGPPPVNRDVDLVGGEEVEDAALVTVVGRAIKNYLAGAQENLRADLTSDAVVTLPAQRLQVQRADDVTWIRPGKRVAVEVGAKDAGETTWTLRYELEVRKSDRWYVRSVQSDTTSKGVSR